MAELPNKGDVIANKYVIESLLGTGGMGAVFAATHRLTGRVFAVKWLLPELTAQDDVVQRFMREAQVGGRVNHPNIVDVYDVGQEGDSFYMVMELLHGEPLSAHLARLGQLSPAETCRIMIPVARALHATHKAGVIHRDLKPENIFLCQPTDGGPDVPKVLDFGISKMSPLAGEVSSRVTRTGVIMGTPLYMAPEQLRSQAVDARTDIYALGVMMYQLLSGSVPFVADNYTDLVLRVMTVQPKPLDELVPGLPRALAELVARAMAREPAKRFETIEALGRALEPFAGGMFFESHSGRPPARSEHPTPRPSTHDSRSNRTPLATESQSLPLHRRLRLPAPPWAAVRELLQRLPALAQRLPMLQKLPAALSRLPNWPSLPPRVLQLSAAGIGLLLVVGVYRWNDTLDARSRTPIETYLQPASTPEDMQRPDPEPEPLPRPSTRLIEPTPTAPPEQAEAQPAQDPLPLPDAPTEAQPQADEEAQRAAALQRPGAVRQPDGAAKSGQPKPDGMVKPNDAANAAAVPPRSRVRESTPAKDPKASAAARSDGKKSPPPSAATPAPKTDPKLQPARPAPQPPAAKPGRPNRPNIQVGDF